jgi:ribosomal protein L29
MTTKAKQPTTDKKALAAAESPETLTVVAKKLHEEAVTLKRTMLSGDVQNIRAYKYKRRELARVLTKINQVQAKKEK